MKNIKRVLSFFCAACILAGVFASAYTYTPTKEPESEAVYFYSVESNSVIYAKNEKNRCKADYLTQIMTVIVALENCPDLETKITIPRYIFDELYVNTGLCLGDIWAGESLSLNDLLNACVVRSACEAASAVADYIGKGSIPKFVEMMNEKAVQLGLKDTHFATPHGMLSDDNYTTAEDMFKLYKYALSNPTFKEMAAKTTYIIKPTPIRNLERPLTSYTYLIDYYRGGAYYYKYATTAKSSGTTNGGRSMVSTAEKGDFSYILVTMNAPMYKNSVYVENVGSMTDHKNLYNWVFDELNPVKVLDKTTAITEIKVALSDNKDFVMLYPECDYSVLLPGDVKVDSIQQIIDIPESINAPVKKGQVVGTMTLKLANQTLTTVNLVADSDVTADGVIRSIYYVGKFLTSPWFFGIIGLLVLGFVVLIIYSRVHKANSRKYKTVRHKRRF